MYLEVFALPKLFFKDSDEDLVSQTCKWFSKIFSVNLVNTQLTIDFYKYNEN